MVKIKFALTLITAAVLLVACSPTPLLPTATTSPQASTPTHPSILSPTPFLDDCQVRDPAIPDSMYETLGYKAGTACKMYAVSPDGKLEAYVKLIVIPDQSGYTEKVMLKDLSSGRSRTLYTIKGSKLWVWELAWEADGRLRFLIAPISGSSTTKIYDPQNDTLADATPAPTPVPERLIRSFPNVSASLLAWLPDGLSLVMAECPDLCAVKLVSAVDGSSLWLTATDGVITSLVVSPDGKTIAALLKKGVINRTETGKILSADTTEVWLYGASDGVVLRHWDAGDAKSLRFDSSGQHLATAGTDIVLWDPASGAETYRLTPAQVNGYAFGPRKARQVHISPAQGGCGGVENFDFVAFDPDQTMLFTSSISGTCAILTAWNMQSSQVQSTTTLSLGIAVDEIGYRNTAIEFEPGQSTVMTIVDDTLYSWNVETGEVIPIYYLAGNFFVASGTLSPDGRTMAMWGMDVGEAGEYWRLGLYDWQAQEITATLFSYDDPLRLTLTAAFSPDGRMLASVDAGGNLFLWDAKP